MEEPMSLFKRRKTHNEIYDDKVVKYTINIDEDDYVAITEQCRKRKIARSVWFREAIKQKFHDKRTTSEMLRYALERKEAEEMPPLPSKVETAVPSGSARPHHDLHKFPGFIGGLNKNSFVLNMFRRELEE